MTRSLVEFVPAARRRSRAVRHASALRAVGCALLLALFDLLPPAQGPRVLAADAPLGPTDGAGLPATDLNRVKPGEQAPDFTLEDQNGHAVTLSSLRGHAPVVLIFYRGHW